MTKETYLLIISILRSTGKTDPDAWLDTYNLLQELAENYYRRNGYEEKFIHGWASEVVNATKTYLRDDKVKVFDDKLILTTPEDIYNMYFTI